MQYDTALQNHGLPHNPFKALVTPRPIGWISSYSEAGILNLAPYSFFNAFCDTPPIVGFGAQKGKDSQSNVEKTGEFVCNIVPYDMREQMSTTSAPVSSDISEFDLANLEQEASSIVSVPRVKAVPAALECKYLQTVEFDTLTGQEAEYALIVGQVVSIYIDDDVINENGIVDVLRFKPLSRLGYRDYAAVTDVFSINRPDQV